MSKNDKIKLAKTHIINTSIKSLNFFPVSKSYKLSSSLLSTPLLLIIFSPKKQKKKLPNEIIASIIPTISPFPFLNHSMAFAVLGYKIIPVPIPLNITDIKS